jgi:phosphate starvation-inducible protein PhoH
VPLDDTIILCDEAEDIKYKQLKMIGTRLGQNSSIILVGDYKQSIYKIINC